MISRTQDWNARFSYSPPLVEIYIPDSQIVAIKKCDAPDRTTQPDWVRVTVSNGQEFLVVGKVSDFDRTGEVKE